MIVKCPYCDKENEIDDSNLCNLDSANYLEDIFCDYCDLEFDIHVEFEPSGTAEGIKYLTCDYCGREHKERKLNKREQTYPFPQGEFNKLCDGCYAEALAKEYVIAKNI